MVYVMASLLFSPLGKHNHFMATDFFLEIQNYWLKQFFNHSGIGTKIDCLKDVFSINIPIVSNYWIKVIFEMEKLTHVLTIYLGSYAFCFRR
jgi:hypothetical protein